MRQGRDFKRNLAICELQFDKCWKNKKALSKVGFKLVNFPQDHKSCALPVSIKNEIRWLINNIMKYNQVIFKNSSLKAMTESKSSQGWKGTYEVRLLLHLHGSKTQFAKLFVYLSIDYLVNLLLIICKHRTFFEPVVDIIILTREIGHVLIARFHLIINHFLPSFNKRKLKQRVQGVHPYYGVSMSVLPRSFH